MRTHVLAHALVLLALASSALAGAGRALPPR